MKKVTERKGNRFYRKNVPEVQDFALVLFFTLMIVFVAWQFIRYKLGI